MVLADRTADSCPICGELLPPRGLKLQHWMRHVLRIGTSPTTFGYTWICECGPAEMCWERPYQAGAGLAIHMLDLHLIAL